MSRRQAETERLAAWNRLMGRITDEADAGRPVPCAAGLLWTSEDDGDQLEAARRCRACHLLADCGRYVVEHPEASGIWAGMSPADQARAHRRAKQ